MPDQPASRSLPGHPHDWAASGAMTLTGRPDGPPLVPDVPLATRVDALARLVRELTAVAGRAADVDGAVLLGERAAIAGLRRRGSTSAGGACRILRCADGHVAVQLARPDDLAMLPAWLGVDGAAAVADAVATRAAGAVAAEGQLLGIPVAALVAPREAATDEQAGARGQAFPFAPLLVDGVAAGEADLRALAAPGGGSLTGAVVVDLTAMWAGPLCAHLLGLAGARIVKVEDPNRPDGARRGPVAFFDLLHAGHESVAVDLRSSEGVRALHEVVERADVVIEGSRPRALEALGFDPAALLERRPATTWVSITAYGRTGPWRDRVGFGDDAAVAGGLAMATDGGSPVFVADAVADPVAGLVAAAGATASVLGGGGHLVDVALREAAGSLLAGAPDGVNGAARGELRAQAPRARVPRGRAPALGADTRRVFADLAIGS